MHMHWRALLCARTCVLAYSPSFPVVHLLLQLDLILWVLHAVEFRYSVLGRLWYELLPNIYPVTSAPQKNRDAWVNTFRHRVYILVSTEGEGRIGIRTYCRLGFLH